jgi:hypothetical protein
MCVRVCNTPPRTFETEFMLNWNWNFGFLTKNCVENSNFDQISAICPQFDSNASFRTGSNSYQALNGESFKMKQLEWDIFFSGVTFDWIWHEVWKTPITASNFINFRENTHLTLQNPKNLHTLNPRRFGTKNAFEHPKRNTQRSKHHAPAESSILDVEGWGGVGCGVGKVSGGLRPHHRHYLTPLPPLVRSVWLTYALFILLLLDLIYLRLWPPHRCGHCLTAHCNHLCRKWVRWRKKAKNESTARDIQVSCGIFGNFLSVRIDFRPAEQG